MGNPEDMKANDKEIPAKRKNNVNNGEEEYQIPKRTNHHFDEYIADDDDDDSSFTKLSLQIGSAKPKISITTPPEPPQSLLPTLHQPPEIPQIETLRPPITSTIATSPNQFPSFHPLFATGPTPQMPEAPSFYSGTVSTPLHHRQEGPTAPQCRPPRARRNTTQTPREGKSEIIPPPFPWATNHRATVHSMEYLLSKKIETISGAVHCKRCEKQYEMGFNLREKFVEVGTFIAENKASMHDRAPSVWMTPVLPSCKYCDQENSVKPLISEKKKSINWLFLLLGQMLGCCTLEQLKYFCKHTKNHRTGAKDRVLYLTYLGLCKQLDPDGPFER
ncbi:hypothetical protein JCGZ_10072 [Jatropha curcas]|uniref:DUF7086 domain-containing protein n=1 Tax=Jatropha curcas TaxID=180498 RepID=A0A067LCZ0_JATCU|nr:uncharacterized protein LOC105634406 [Jatropha curcas]KDP46232.1 hypothetical protein JCGZ_10072 [Jatropha curcas]